MQSEGGNVMNRISKFDGRRGGEPQPIGDVLAELLAQYEDRFPAARIAVVETAPVTEDPTCLFYPAASANAS
jgi:hypothetical protein